MTQHHNFFALSVQITPLFIFLNLNPIQQNETGQKQSVAYPGILFGEGSTNSVEDRGQRMGIWGW